MKLAATILLASLVGLQALANPHPVAVNTSILLPPGEKTGGTMSPMTSYPITVTTSNDAPVVSGGRTNPPAYLQATNPIVFGYSTNLHIASNGAPVLQYILQDDWIGFGRILVQCYSNSIYYLESSTNLAKGNWKYLQEVGNQSIYTFYTTNSASQFFRLVAVTNRFYVTMLPAPDGTPAIGVMVFPEWDINYSYYFSITNVSPTNASFSFCAVGDELLVPVYPDHLTNYMSNWQCAYITDYYLNSTGAPQSAYVAITMPAGCHYMTFEPNFMFGIADPGQPTPHMVDPCPGTFPNLYLGTFGCSPGSPTNSPFPGQCCTVVGSGGGSGGNLPPLSIGPIYVPTQFNPITLNPGPENSPISTGPGGYPLQGPNGPGGEFPAQFFPGIPGGPGLPPLPPENDPAPNPNTPPANAPCVFEQLFHNATGL